MEGDRHTLPYRLPKCQCRTQGPISVADRHCVRGWGLRAACLSGQPPLSCGRCPCGLSPPDQISFVSGQATTRARARATYLIARVHVHPLPVAVIFASIFHVVLRRGHCQSIWSRPETRQYGQLQNRCGGRGGAACRWRTLTRSRPWSALRARGRC